MFVNPSSAPVARSEEHTSELQSRENLVCRLLLEKKNKRTFQTCFVEKKKTRRITKRHSVLTCSHSPWPRNVPRCPNLGLTLFSSFFFFFTDPATTEIYTLSLHDALPICEMQARCLARRAADAFAASPLVLLLAGGAFAALPVLALWAGRSAAPALQSADHRAVVVSAALVAGLAGAAVTLLVPGPRALGCQLEAAPVPWPVAFAGLVLFPVSVALVLVLPAAALFVAPSAGARTPLVLARVLG